MDKWIFGSKLQKHILVYSLDFGYSSMKPCKVEDIMDKRISGSKLQTHTKGLLGKKRTTSGSGFEQWTIICPKHLLTGGLLLTRKCANWTLR